MGRIDWIEPDAVAACAYPRDDAMLAELAAAGVTTLINLTEWPHGLQRLDRHGIREISLPVADFTPPSPGQLNAGVAAIEQTLTDGGRVAVHCHGGLGRTGTLLACWLVRRGLPADTAIEQVRAVRPGSVETAAQEASIRSYAARSSTDAT